MSGIKNIIFGYLKFIKAPVIPSRVLARGCKGKIILEATAFRPCEVHFKAMVFVDA